MNSTEEKRNKKVLFVTASTTGGGAERMLFNIIRSLDDKHQKHLFITSDQRIPDEYVSDIEARNENKRHAICAFPKLIRELKKFKPDHVFTTSSNIGYMLVLAKKILRERFKIYIRCAVTPSEIYQSDLKTRLLNRIIKLTYNSADLIIAQTDFMRDDLIRSYELQQDKVRVIRNIIDKEYIQSQSEQFIPKEFQAGKYNIVAAGALYSVKGFDILIDAVAPLLKENENIMLYILGDERYEAGYKDFLYKKITDAGLGDRILLLGHRNNPYPYLKNADLFAMSSRKEGFPNVVLESLSLGTPVVATDCVDFTGVVEEGINGYVVHKNDAESLRKGISTAIVTKFNLDRSKIENFDYNRLFS